MMDETDAIWRARKFIERAKIDSIPVDLSLYLKIAEAKYKVRDDLEDDEAGRTTVIAGKCYIFVNGRHSIERQRFTLLHEIAHIVLDLPSMHDQGLNTGTLYRYARRPKEEILCDVFAAECLLPADFFKKDLEQLAVGLDSVKELAASYQASLTSTGSRFAFLHGEPCAFVLTEAGKVRYVSSSKPMRERGCWISIGMDIPQGSVARQLLDGLRVDGPIEIDSSLWLEQQKGRRAVLLEESYLLGEWDQILSLLWFESDEDSWTEDEDDDDEPALKELDGILPWPSKSRRR